MTDLSDRLDRIDVKPDKLSEAASQLGRIKNTFAIRHESMGQIDSRLNDIEVRIRTLEHQSSSRNVLRAGCDILPPPS
ncbi:hypothetical protein [Endozoicomonas sp. ONNA2]|uniref:hypothetical protein n=1 Tax=Endozoicomonas sp. ONNA2 TaxID=2828741 RepID=UPI002148F9D3|nr:hypothetical protein [Endozoicomonas sp. ONNA2]